MRLTSRTTVTVLLSAVILGALLAGCAGSSIAGTAGPVPGTAEPGPYHTTCEVTAATVDGPPVETPTADLMVTVTPGTNLWIANERTQPLAIAVYDDGTAIRSESAGTADEPIATLTIGRLDPCLLANAAAEIVALAAVDIGSPGVTDQGTTRVVLRQPTGDVIVDAYALGVDDQVLPAPQQAARQRLTALIDTLGGAMTNTAPWTPDRVRVSTYGKPATDAGALSWPLAGGLQKTLDHDDHRCGVLSGAQATSVLEALGRTTAVGPWTDGTQTLVLAFGPLVPGQHGCPT